MDLNSYDSQKILEYIGEGLLYADNKGKMLFINSAAEKLTGWSEDECIGRRIEDVFQIKNIYSESYLTDYCYEALESVIEKGLPKGTIFVKKDQSFFFISAKISSVKNEENEICGIVIVFRDISRLKSIEDRLSAEQKNFKTRFETAPVGMLLTDEELKIKDLNKSMLRIMDKDFDDCIGKRFGDAFGCINSITDAGCGKSAECCECSIQKGILDLIKNNEEYVNLEIEYETIIRKKRILKWMNINVTKLDVDGPRNYLFVIDDITEKKKIDEALIRSRNYYISLFENFPALVWRSGLDTECDYFNNNWLMFTGKTLGQELGNGWIEGVHPDDLKRVEHTCLEAFNNREAFQLEFRLRYKDGSYRWVRDIGHPIYELNEEFAGYIGAVFDISEHKEMMNELKTAKEEAEAANKAKSQFLANMSHEIRTPLNGMVGMIDLTLMGELKHEQRDNLQTAKSCVDSLLNIINDILDLSKIEAGKMEIVNSSLRLEDLLEQTVKPYKIKAVQNNVKVDYAISSDLPEYFVGDKLRINQVLNNLLSNALKFTLAGSINLRVDKYLKDNEEFILFQVSDTGIGIAKEEMDKLFKNFSQVDSTYTRKYNGTGLGLAISKRLVSKMGGSIWVESDKGIGSAFYFTIRLERGIPQNKTELNGIQSYKSSKELDILVVDDDRINQTVIVGLLSKFGHRVTTANNGLEAIKLISENNFELVFMDIQMPEMDGIEATRYIRELESEKYSDNGKEDKKYALQKLRLPIVALTAYAIEGDKENFLASGMDWYLSKPIIMSELFDTIEKIIKDKEDTDIENIIGGSGKFIEPRENIDKSFLNDLIVNLNKAFDNYNAVLVEKYSHLIKEYIGRFDAKEIYENALRIELSARKDKLEGVQKFIEKIESIFKELNI